MNTTLSGVRSYVRSMIQEPNPSYWSNSELNLYINQAKDDLFNAICLVNEDFFLEQSTLNIVAGTTRYELPANFFRLKNLYATNEDSRFQEWVQMDRADPSFVAGLNTNVDGGDVFRMRYDLSTDVTNKKSYIDISPIPRNNMTLKLEYISCVPDLTSDTDVFAIFDPFVGYIKDKAISYALMKGPAGDFSSWDTLAKDKLKTILTDAGRRQSKDPQFVRGHLED